MTTAQADEYFARPRVNVVSACLIAGVSRATLYRWISMGLVEVVRTPSGQPRIYADTLLKREPDDD
jgi:predicted site-specific integrase-resolvase